MLLNTKGQTVPTSQPPVEGVTWLRAPRLSSESGTSDIENTVSEVLSEVKSRGDAAVADFSVRFDKSDLTAFEVTEAERQEALNALDSQTRADTEFAIANVTKFAEAQLATMLPLEVEIREGVHLGHRIIPLERVGCYVPGGRYPLLSAPVMTIVPAKVAGVDEIIACLPPNAHPAMIAGCHLSGADRIFRIGGAQAIAAMAFGTGHHGTTLGCLRALDRLANEGFEGQSVADIGCGTAVLAMAAARIWPQEVLASDIDRVAVDVAEANVRANGLEGRVACVEATGFDHPDIAARAPFDLVFANILMGPLIALAPDMARALDTGGYAILSGILTEQADEVIAVYSRNGINLVQREDIVEWTTLTLRKSS